MSGAMMPEPDVPLEALRATVERVTRATSLRHVARLVGMSPSGLGRFLDGSTPSPRTRSRLLVLFRPGVVQGDWTAEVNAETVLSFAVAHLPSADRNAAARELRAVVARRSRAARVPVPAWADDGLGN